MTRFVLVILSFLTFSVTTKAENPCGVMFPQNTGEWGTGTIWIPKDTNIKIRNSQGEVIGSISRDPKHGHVKVNFNDSEEKANYTNDFVWAGHSSVVLIKVYKTDSEPLPEQVF